MGIPYISSYVSSRSQKNKENSFAERLARGARKQESPQLLRAFLFISRSADEKLL